MADEGRAVPTWFGQTHLLCHQEDWWARSPGCDRWGSTRSMTSTYFLCQEMRAICSRALCVVLPFGENTTSLVCRFWSVFFHFCPVRRMGNLNVWTACMDIVIQWEELEAINKFSIDWVDQLLPVLAVVLAPLCKVGSWQKHVFCLWGLCCFLARLLRFSNKVLILRSVEVTKTLKEL